MIVSDIVTRVQKSFGDMSAVQIDENDIMRWINDGQVEIVKNNDAALQTTAFIDLVANQAEYTLPTDLLLLRSLRFKKEASQLSYSYLKYVSMQQFDETLDGWDGTQLGTGFPQFFTMYEGKAILFPIPDTSLVSGIKVLYNKKPVDVTLTTDVLSLPLIYHNSVFKYCMWQASVLDEDYEPAIMHQTNFQADMDLLKLKENSEPTDFYPTITVLEDDW